jgi:hypothetical protein
MLVKATNGEVYHVTWQYENRFEERYKTHCLVSQIYPDNTKMLIVRGTAECSYKDQFNKNKGRKLSLSRALITERPTVEFPTKEHLQIWAPVFDRNLRKEFWDAYFKMRGKLE